MGGGGRNTKRRSLKGSLSVLSNNDDPVTQLGCSYDRTVALCSSVLLCPGKYVLSGSARETTSVSVSNMSPVSLIVCCSSPFCASG